MKNVSRIADNILKGARSNDYNRHFMTGDEFRLDRRGPVVMLTAVSSRSTAPLTTADVPRIEQYMMKNVAKLADIVKSKFPTSKSRIETYVFINAVERGSVNFLLGTTFKFKGEKQAMRKPIEWTTTT